MSVREKGKQRRRQRICQAASDLLVEMNGDSLSVAAIAERAEVGQTTLYNLIGGINDIVDELVRDIFREFSDELNIDSLDSPGEAVLAIVAASYESLKGSEKKKLAILKYSYSQRTQHGARQGAVGSLMSTIDQVASLFTQFKQNRLLDPDCDTALLAQQILFALIINLEQWMSGLVSLDVYKAQSQLHLLVLVKAWSSAKHSKNIKVDILILQKLLNQL